MSIAKFQAGRGVVTYICRKCGKHTRVTVGDEGEVRLCALCYDQAVSEIQAQD